MFKAKLLREKKYNNVRFHAGQVVEVRRNPSGTINIAGYPSITLGDKDYEMHIPEKDMWRLLLQ